MKTFFTLTMAVVAFSPVYSQSGMPGDPLPDKKPVLTHADSLVLAEAGAWLADSLFLPDPLLKPAVELMDFPAAIDAVLRDFPNNLRHISGALELAQGEFENYASLVLLPGAEKCIVTRWHSVDDTTASWQARLFSGDDFDEAAKQYRLLYRKLQGCYVRLIDGSVVYLSGEWEPVKKGASFTTSTLRLVTGDTRYKEVKVELELAYELADWSVRINIVSKRRDDEVGGRTIADAP